MGALVVHDEQTCNMCGVLDGPAARDSDALRGALSFQRGNRTTTSAAEDLPVSVILPW